jgi:hypothetical protein
MITFRTPKHHWNYFLAIEKDLEKLSRYIEFSEPNLKTYSIELTHILLSASSEIDVIIKQLCELIDPAYQRENINNYKDIIRTKLKPFILEEISIDRYGLTYKPWIKWNGNRNPNWWRSYNNVKHQRNIFYSEANLQNTINSVGALLITVIYYYKFAFEKESGNEMHFKEVTRQLIPESSFIRINADYYYDLRIC